jgi:hypothetical protein
MPTLDPGPFRDMAAALRTRDGFNGQLLKFIKGKWALGRNGLDVTGHQFASRPDWCLHGWTKWWDGRITDYRLGFVSDRFVPPVRQQLGDDDEELWRIWTKGRDPWVLQWHLPLFNQISGEQVLWTTDTLGGRDCLAALLNAFADRLDSAPEDGKILPVVELDTDSYQHPTRARIFTPQLNIINWCVPPATPRPPLPTAPTPALPSPASKEADAVLTDAAPLDDQIPF